MPNIQISDLPAALPLTGAELVPIVQDGITVRTTTAQVAGSPILQETFLTVNQEPSLPNSRYFSTSSGISITDNGPLNSYRIDLTGAAASLNSAGNGFQVKTNVNTVTNRSLATSGNGLSVTNGSGVSGNPTFQLTDLAAAIANMSGTGLVALQSSLGFTPVSIVGTNNQISVTNGNASGGSPIIGLADNPVIPGTIGMTLPSGATTALGNSGGIRFNTDNNTFEGYISGNWIAFSTAGGLSSFSAGSTGLTPNTPTVGSVVLAGTLNVPSGGTGVGTLTGYVKGTGTSPLSAVSTIPTTDLSGTVSNAQLANSAITINGNTVSLGGSTTVTATATSALTIGTGLTGTSYNGSSPVTIAIDSTVATLNGTQTFTNKSISGATNTLSAIPNNALSNSSVTVGTTSIALGGTSTTLAGLTSVTLTQDPTSNLEAATKQYVDALASGLNFHQACNYATTAALPSNTYNNGTSGVGATLTANANGTLTIDGYTFVSGDVGKRILVKNEVAGANNGIYTLTQAGTVSLPYILTRATDFNSSGSGPNQINAGDLTLILSGSTLANTSWVQQTPLPITIGTTAITFVQFAAPLVYTAGTGLTESPPFQFNIANTGVTAAAYGAASKTLTATVNAQGQLTLLADANIAIDGNQITSGTVGSAYITGSYTGITGVGTLTAGTWNATTIGVPYGGTGLTSYAIGDLLYASGTAALSKLALGTADYVLTAGLAAPQYVAQSTLSVGAATTATNLAGGAAGSIPYQTAAGTTTMLAVGTNGYVLTLAGGVPTWAASTGGVTSFQTSLDGLTPSTGTTGAITLAGTLGAISGGTSFSTYATGDIIYASATNTLSKLAAGTNGYVLTLAGGVPTWAAGGGGGMVYPGAGIPNSTGTAWGTSYTTTGSGTVVALQTSPSFTTPDIGAATGTSLAATGSVAGSVVSATNGILINNNSIAANYSIPSGYSGMSTGPITVASGIAITVPSGSRWVVV
jgi:hypothetical protein